MRTSEELKQLLCQIRDNDYNVPEEVDVDGIIADMLRFIDHTDAELRDKLIYMTFAQWGERNVVFSAVQKKHMLDTCLSDSHLFFGISEKDTDSVFTRSFSSLLIDVLLFINNEVPFLTTEDINNIKKAVALYIGQEKDYRGYVDGKGWAHAVAHTADVLASIANVGKAADVDGGYSIGREGMLEVLHNVKSLVCNNEYVYSAGEDERLVTPFMVVADQRVLAVEELIDWIASFNMADNEYWKGTMPDAYYLYLNRRDFMRSLYFRLQSQRTTEGFEEISKFVHGLLV